uniref:AIG1-type G domain-containing protein n=1 Tax=Poecilia latipinna TaxID=48699 RepID=A0A3B3UV47_9TELE
FTAQSHPATELRIVLIGGRLNGSLSGKSSAGNFILGQNVFDTSRRTAQSEARQKEVFGRRVTVVDTPGWWWICEMDKLEIENSVNLCPPGPHAVLLVIPVIINIDESYLRSVQQHMSLFREEIWKHTLVLFTYGDWLGVKTVEERIESDEGLQWIVNKCENRYHVLNNKDHSDKTQVKELLEKIEEMWAGNEDDPYYEVELDRAAELETKRETGDKMNITVIFVYFTGESHPVTDIRIVLVGQKCSGKSEVGNMIMSNEKFKMTSERAWLTNAMPHPDTQTVDAHVSMCSPGPHVFLLVVLILRSFTEKDLKALVEIMKPLTERVWRHCMVVFTWGHWLSDLPVENYIVREGKELQELLEKCGNRYHVLNPNRYSDAVQVKELFQKIINMVKQNKGCFTAEKLRIVLIGGRYNDLPSGKSSAGNIILGQNVFDTSRRTAQSEAKQQEVFGRRVTVVDTPGWWWGWPREETPKLDQIEIQNSVHLCPPGPHVFLLVIPVDLPEDPIVKSSLQQHLELFNADVFIYTIVLFTAVSPCSDEEIESKIRRNPVLQWILQQCGNRKHFLNFSNREDRDQVKKLLEKIETLITNNGFRHCSVDRSQGETLRKEMRDLTERTLIANNGFRHCSVDRSQGETLRKEMRDLTERASKRFDQVQKQRNKLKLQIEGRLQVYF